MQARVATAVALLRRQLGHRRLVRPLQQLAGFTRGVAVGKYNGTSWTWTESALTGVPTRYASVAMTVGWPPATSTLAVNGFRPGASPKVRAPASSHIFTSADGGSAWTDISNNFPDVPTNSIKVLASGALRGGHGRSGASSI